MEATLSTLTGPIGVRSAVARSVDVPGRGLVLPSRCAYLRARIRSDSPFYRIRCG